MPSAGPPGVPKLSPNAMCGKRNAASAHGRRCGVPAAPPPLPRGPVATTPGRLRGLRSPGAACPRVAAKTPGPLRRPTREAMDINPHHRRLQREMWPRTFDETKSPAAPEHETPRRLTGRPRDRSLPMASGTSNTLGNRASPQATSTNEINSKDSHTQDYMKKRATPQDVQPRRGGHGNAARYAPQSKK